MRALSARKRTGRIASPAASAARRFRPRAFAIMTLPPGPSSTAFERSASTAAASFSIAADCTPWRSASRAMIISRIDEANAASPSSDQASAAASIISREIASPLTVGPAFTRSALRHSALAVSNRFRDAIALAAGLRAFSGNGASFSAFAARAASISASVSSSGSISLRRSSLW